MKNVLKLTLLSASFAISTSIIAQEAAKKQDDKKSTTQTTTKTTTKTTAKTSSKETKKDDSDSSKSGGTRMAITEQGTPKKKNAKASNAPADTKSDTPKK